MARPSTRWLLVLALAATATPARAALDARALVDSVAAHYAALSAYHFEGVIVTRTTGDAAPPGPPVETHFTIAAIRPLRLHNDFSSTQRAMRWIADGESLYVHSVLEGAYVVQPAPRLAPGTSDDDPRAALLEPLLNQAQLARRLLRVEEVGQDTVHTATGTTAVRVLRLTYAPDTTRAWLTEQPRVIAVDEARRLILRDSLVADAQHPQYGRMHQETVQRVTFADDRSGGPDSLYHFRPGAASRIVDAVGRSPEPPPLAGKPGPAFSLPGLDGKRVALASLRGHVVVLDFWATWCGPCRRWLPIVAKLERELRPRGVRCYAVNERDQPAPVRDYLKAQNLDVPVLLDADGAVGSAYMASAIPLTVVVGKDGKVVQALLGLHSEEDLREALRKAGVSGI